MQYSVVERKDHRNDIGIFGGLSTALLSLNPSIFAPDEDYQWHLKDLCIWSDYTFENVRMLHSSNLGVTYKLNCQCMMKGAVSSVWCFLVSAYYPFSGSRLPLSGQPSHKEYMRLWRQRIKRDPVARRRYLEKVAESSRRYRAKRKGSAALE